jgi:hypothetical protein
MPATAVRSILGIKQRITVMVLGYKDKILCSSVSKEIDPLASVELCCSKVGNKIVIDNILLVYVPV